MACPQAQHRHLGGGSRAPFRIAGCPCSRLTPLLQEGSLRGCPCPLLPCHTAHTKM